MPRGSAFILRICFCLAEMADKIIYWVKIAGQELSALVFPRSLPSFALSSLLSFGSCYLQWNIYLAIAFGPSIMLAPCWCYLSGSVDSMFTQWGRCWRDMTTGTGAGPWSLVLSPLGLCVCAVIGAFHANAKMPAILFRSRLCFCPLS